MEVGSEAATISPPLPSSFPLPNPVHPSPTIPTMEGQQVFCWPHRDPGFPSIHVASHRAAGEPQGGPGGSLTFTWNTSSLLPTLNCDSKSTVNFSSVTDSAPLRSARLIRFRDCRYTDAELGGWREQLSLGPRPLRGQAQASPCS